MKIASKTLVLVVACAVLGLTMAGCNSSKPTAKQIQSAVDHDLDRSFTTVNNGGKVFTVSGLTIKSIKEKSESDLVKKLNEKEGVNDYIAHVSFTLIADSEHPQIFNMNNSPVISEAISLQKGEKYTFKDARIDLSVNKKGLVINSL